MREHPKSRHHTGLATHLWRAVLAVFGVAVLSACSGEQNALDPAGPYAQAPHDLILIVIGIAAVVLVFVQGLIIFSVVKFRTRKDDDGSLPKQVHGNTRLEILWTIIPAVILAVIAAPTVQLVFETMDEPDEEFMTVHVIGHRWWFEYYYPDYDIYTANEFAIPAGTPVRLEMRSGDPGRAQDQAVIHSFWVPRLAGKQDMLPNHTTYLNIEADEPGRYIGQCAEYCGLSHANMRARVEALSAADFASWVESQQAAAVLPAAGTPEGQGRELFHDLGDRKACASCHQVWEGDGQRRAAVGPDLTHLMSRQEFLGAIEDLDEATLRQWLQDPDSLKPMQYESNGIGMPNLNLTEGELDALVAYLLTLR
ncbi:MAG: cytochrome c oxidase subunit II [Nitriliruptoraceae bacterium]